MSKRRMNIFYRPAALLLLTILFVSSSFSVQPETSPDDRIEFRVDSLLSLMTLEEKIGQMTQVRHFSDITNDDIKNKFIGSVIHTDGPLPGEGAIGWQERFTELQKIALSTRLGIPLVFGVDAVHGQNTFEGATVFPHNIGMGATANAQLIREAAEITAIEMKATGFNWTFSPCIAIPYNEKWGRFYEAFSESTELTSKLVAASVEGHQGNLSYDIDVMATAKHYLGDGSTDYGIEGNICSLSRQEISERLIPPYRTAVNQGVGSVMVSFNSLQGHMMHANKEYITDTLKNAMNFDGIVVSDWKGYSRFGENEIIKAGVDMLMAVDGDMDVFQQGLLEGVKSGDVPMERIDDAVRRILRQKFRLGLFENPFPNNKFIEKIGCDEHRDKARQAVRESLVLLKNKKKTLPLDKSTAKIVVVGEHAHNSGLQSGGWSLSWQGRSESYQGATTILDGIKQLAEGEVIYDKDGSMNYKNADVAIIVVGETPYAEFMGDIKEGNPYQLTLTEKHKEYIDAYDKRGTKLVVILVSGRPLVVNDQIDQSDAFIAAWLPGSEGDGIAEVLFGDYNFTGTLPHSWPGSVGDFNGKFGPNFWNDSITPLYKIAYGLKY